MERGRRLYLLSETAGKTADKTVYSQQQQVYTIHWDWSLLYSPCQKFVIHLRGREVEPENSVSDMDSPLLGLIRGVRSQVFGKEIKALTNQQSLAAASPLKLLNPIFFDGVLRVGGRLENARSEEKHPIVLPKHLLTKLIIQDAREICTCRQQSSDVCCAKGITS